MDWTVLLFTLYRTNIANSHVNFQNIVIAIKLSRTLWQICLLPLEVACLESIQFVLFLELFSKCKHQ